MRGAGRSWLVVLPVWAILASCAPRTDPPPASIGTAVELFAQRRYFELRKLLPALPVDGSPELLFLRGMTAAFFNRPRASADDLNAFLRQAGGPASQLRRIEALGVLAEDYTNLFQYGRSAEARAEALRLGRDQLRPSGIADSERLIAFWRGLDGVPPQTVTVPEYTVLSLVGDIEVMADFGGPLVALLPDTGASLSLITRAEAERLGFRILRTPITIGTATGEGVTAYPGLAPEFKIVDIVIRNAVFLVVPERMLYFPEIKRQRSGVLGFPILSALGPFTFDHSGRTLIVSGQANLGGEPNFFLYNNKPVIRAEYGRDRIQLMLDTGSYSSQLFPPFYRSFQDEVQKRGAQATATIEGIGTQIKVPVYLMGGLGFTIAGQRLDFRRELVILTQPTSEESDIFDGSLGSDIMEIFPRVTLDYGAMRIGLARR
jgi:hypothetical protein